MQYDVGQVHGTFNAHWQSTSVLVTSPPLLIMQQTDSTISKSLANGRAKRRPTLFFCLTDVPPPFILRSRELMSVLCYQAHR